MFLMVSDCETYENQILSFNRMLCDVSFNINPHNETDKIVVFR
jgi:hypothetical protein